MNTNLNLLLDESVTDPLARMLAVCPGVQKVVEVRKVLRGALDPAVIEYATKEELIVVTTETAMDERTFKICTHPGIIVLCGRNRHENAFGKCFRDFMLSGHRKKAVHAVIHVSHHKARIETMSGTETVHFE